MFSQCKTVALSLQRQTLEKLTIIFTELTSRASTSALNNSNLGMDFLLTGATNDFAATKRRKIPLIVCHRSQITAPYANSPPSQKPCNSASFKASAGRRPLGI